MAILGGMGSGWKANFKQLLKLSRNLGRMDKAMGIRGKTYKGEPSIVESKKMECQKW